MSYERLTPNYSLTKEKLEEIKRIIPDAFADGRINWQFLKDELSDHLEDDGADAEHFGLFWPGKREARRVAAIPSKGTLIPAHGEGIDEENTRNIFIEGENLEVLKILQKSYAGKIRMIYIDPPYNTGHDFVYEDDFREPLAEYLQRTGQVDEKGKMTTTNTRADGRFHSRWLSMMYPRLKLAKNLLREDGIIFVSIDDNEVNNLRSVMNEIFGEENLISQIVWKKTYGGGSKAKHVVGLHEYIIIYAQSKETLGEIVLPPEPNTRKYYTGKDAKYESRGPYRTQPLATNSMDERPNLRFPIEWNGDKIWPEKQWQWSQERVISALKNDELLITKQSGKWSVRYKQYLYDENGKERGAKPFSVLDGPYTQEGTTEMKDLFDNGKIFPFPKPSNLIKHLISYVWSDKSAIVLDFFAGSGSSAQAVFKLNKEDGGNRRFILVQLPEQVEDGTEPSKLGFETIAAICKERIRRISKLLKSEETKGDIGLKVLKLAKSNYKIWQDYEGKRTIEFEEKLNLFETPLVDGWKPERVLTEIILIEGFPLDCKIEERKIGKKNIVHHVISDASEHKLLVCLDEKLDDHIINDIEIDEQDVFICLDSGLTDKAKMRLADKCRLKTI